MYNTRSFKADAWHDLYTSGYSSITGYTIGIMFGYLFYKYRNEVLSVKRVSLKIPVKLKAVNVFFLDSCSSLVASNVWNVSICGLNCFSYVPTKLH